MKYIWRDIVYNITTLCFYQDYSTCLICVYAFIKLLRLTFCRFSFQVEGFYIAAFYIAYLSLKQPFTNF